MSMEKSPKQVPSSEDKLAGFYSPAERKNEFDQRLQHCKNIFQSHVLNEFDSSSFLEIKKHKEKSKNLQYVHEQLAKLSVMIEAYRTDQGHFDKEYQKLNGACEKLLLDIDGLVFPNIAFGDTKQDLLEKTQLLVEEINNKMHSDGKCCTACPLYRKSL